MRLPALLIIAALAAPGAAFADLWHVGPLPPGDTLNIRSGPAPSFPATGRLEPGTGGLERRVCVRLVTDPAETDARRLPEWCLIAQGGADLGWVAARYLAPDDLRIMGGYRGHDDPCRRFGESAATADWLDDAADLVGCPTGDDGIADLQDRYKARIIGDLPGWVMLSVPRR
jgi:hypothetical protein